MHMRYNLPAVLVAPNGDPVALADRAVTENVLAARFMQAVTWILLDAHAYFHVDHAAKLFVNTHFVASAAPPFAQTKRNVGSSHIVGS